MDTQTFEYEEMTYFMKDDVWICGERDRSFSMRYLGRTGHRLVFSTLNQTTGILTDTWERARVTG